MADKISTIYVCSNCDAQFYKWNGRCLECGGWGTLQMQTIDIKSANKTINVSPAEIINLEKLNKQTEFNRLTVD